MLPRRVLWILRQFPTHWDQAIILQNEHTRQFVTEWYWDKEPWREGTLGEVIYGRNWKKQQKMRKTARNVGRQVILHRHMPHVTVSCEGRRCLMEAFPLPHHDSPDTPKKNTSKLAEDPGQRGRTPVHAQGPLEVSLWGVVNDSWLDYPVRAFSQGR